MRDKGFTTFHSHIFGIVWLIVFIYSSLFFRQVFGTVTASFLGAQIAGGLLPIVLMLLFMQGRGVSFSDILPFRRPDTMLVLMTVALGLLIQPLGMAVSGLTSLLGADTAPMDALSTIMDTPHWLGGFILIAVVPSIFEEIVCRGVFLSGYRRVDAHTAAVVNGIAFGLMHLNVRQFMYAFVLGYAIAFLVIRSGNILYAILMHFIINGSQFYLTHLLSRNPVDATQIAYGMTEDELTAAEAAGLVGTLFILAGLAFICMLGYMAVYKRFIIRCNRLTPDVLTLADNTNDKIHYPSLILFIAFGGVIIWGL
ncbi:MAG: CPBP family intramembrane metalloprotease [Defluviitaleaceae bacterium]|nr:CPBP family intramembrane metalloprotease [Defluviitaleaceae bacterium]